MASDVNTVTICATCDGPGAALADALRPKLPEWTVRMHECLNICSEPISVAVQSPDKATYVFAGVTADDADDMVNFAVLYEASADGWIEDATPAGRLRFCLKTRVPAL